MLGISSYIWERVNLPENYNSLKITNSVLSDMTTVLKFIYDFALYSHDHICIVTEKYVVTCQNITNLVQLPINVRFLVYPTSV